jgi:transposase
LETARRLSIPKGALRNWLANAKAGGLPAAPGARSVPGLEAEAARLRKELADARLERDIVKKAAACFAKESMQGTRS